MHIKGHAIRSTTAPSRPVTPTISNVSDTSLTFTWTANTEPTVVSYNIMRSTDGSTYTLLVTDWPTASYTDTGLTSGQIYYYRVASKSSNGQVSEFSFVVSQETTATGQLTWSLALPTTIEFNYGVANTFDLDPYISGTPSSITVETGTLPPNVTIVNQTLSYDGGGSSSGHTETGISLKLNSTAVSDWAIRINDANVVWYHDFSSSNEVRNFRWTGGVGLDVNDTGAQDVYWEAGGITGGCLVLKSPAYPSNDDSGWWRPFSPIVGGTTTGNGRGANDPGAGITPRAWDTTNTNTTSNHGVGYYGNTAYQNANFDGTDYWVQVRVKMDQQWWLQPVQNRTGKFMYLTSTKRSLTGQEMVTNAPSQLVNGGGSFYMYRSGSPSLQSDYLADTGIDLSQVMPGGTCNFGTNPGGCWSFPHDEWVTLLYHLDLGTEAAGNTFIEVWAARTGQTSYTKIWEQDSIPLPYESDIPKGHNAMLLSPGANEVRTGTVTQDLVMRVGQIIFKKGNGTRGVPLIACPQV